MSALQSHVAALIAREGPLGVADYMALALGHPRHGYYMTHDPLGAQGDFTTAPEISQMFGELIGLWCADLWQRMGAPGEIVLAEMGPGRGTLMRDALRAARQALPAFADAAKVHLVETSPPLRAAQRALLGGGVQWHDRLDTLPEGPVLLIANEFFDALPIRQFARTERGWCERCVTLEDGALRFALAPDPAPQGAIPAAFSSAAPGDLIEFSPLREAVAAQIAARVERSGGAALLIDYGHAVSAPGDTLQALKAHRFADPLAEPGEADLTSHVDFAALARAAQGAGAQVFGPVPQGAFLHALGIVPRAQRLKHDAPGDSARAIGLALARLTEADQMGELFKAMAIASQAAPVPAGF